MVSVVAEHPEALGRALLAPGSPELRALLERRPARMLRDVAVYAAMLLGAFALVSHAFNAWTFAVAFVVVGNAQYGLSILTHEGNHAVLFRSRRANDLFALWALCAPLGVDFDGERHNHLEHHRLFATDADPDRYLYVLADKNSRARLLWFLTGFSSLPHIVAKGRRNARATAADGARRHPLTRGRVPTLLAQLLIAALVATVLPAWCYVALWLAPLYVMAFVPHKIRMLCEHAQLVLPDERADRARLLTFRPSFVERAFIAPLGLDHHAEHHMFPSVPYYNLPKLARVVATSPHVETRSSYVRFVLRALVAMPLAH